MATAKREIYARAAVQLRTHDRCREAERACPGAMGLYLFLLLQARGEQTHGEVLDLAAYESWGAPVTYRKKQARALVAAGLVEEKNGRLVVVKYLEHNDGPEDIAAAKERVNVRQDRKRHPEKYASENTIVTRDTGVTAPHLSISCSSSLSESRSEEPDPARAATPVHPRVAVPDPSASPPTWWDGVLATIHANVGVLLAAGECWLAYAGHRHGKRLPATREDALQWLVQVMVPKARKAAQDERRTRDRDARWDAERKAVQAPAPAPYHAKPKPAAEVTPAELAETQRLAKTVGGKLFAFPPPKPTGTD